ncbi:MAG: hypothetical protein K2O89_00925 [Clostridia bacterium]|nr:hypothetical protein [Clostridia bacterium]
MKKNIKKFLSAAAVLAISATAAIAVIPVAGCSADESAVSEKDKYLSVDENHSADVISTASGTVQTKNSGKTYYVTTNGGINNSGESWDQPITLSTILTTEGLLKPGDTVYVAPGNYDDGQMRTIPETTRGTYDNYIRIVNAALEREESGYTGTDTLVTLDFSAQPFASDQRGIQIYGSYIYWYGLDVCGAGDNGLYIGGNYNTVEYCEFYNNRDTGLQLGRSGSHLSLVDQWPSYNLIKNCTSHNNYDNETYGENADGFAAKLTVGYGNVFDGCIAYRNSDDGWDLYAKTDSGNIGCVIIYNCVAFENGYLEYTQKDNNARFSRYNSNYDESNTNSYKTRDGDGNGFKLGGSVMEGDVEMYNCLSFHNRMHGVTDNSNPGFLKVEGVTSYDNSAAIDDNPESATFGQIIQALNHDTHSNIDLARQTYSYNSVIDTLSVGSGVALSLESDAYRGSVTDSVLLGSNKAANVINGSIDADTKNGGKTYTSQDTALVASQIFKELPIDLTNENNPYNLTGLYDLYADGALSGNLNPNRVHLKYRNEDMSINMQDILAKKDGIDDEKLLEGKNIGSTLNLSSWSDYEHFFTGDVTDASKPTSDEANLARAIETLTINTYNKAVYQDFEVPIKLNGCTISWVSSNPDVVTVGTDVENSVSTSQYITMLVYRPSTEDVNVKITATIKYGAATGTKEFNLTIKAGQPSIGTIKVLTPDGVIIEEGGSYVVDQYAIFTEPEVLVENGLDYNGKLLKPEQFTYTTTYRYATDKNSPSVQIKGFTPSSAGVYTVTQKVTLGEQTKSMTYTIFVSSETANVDFTEGTDSVVVNKDGYMISGNLSNATGMIYAVSSSDDLTVTPENIKTLAGVKSYSFRTDNINFQFENTNSTGYKIYYALANLSGEITSEIHVKEVTVVDVSTCDDFMTIAGGGKIGEENAETTIYRLTKDLDFTGVTWVRNTSSFKGLINGAGYTVKNVTVTLDEATAGAGLFYKVDGGTIENIKFDNISVTGGKQQTGIVATSYGGYFHNIAITNVKISGVTRVGGLIGQVFESALPTKISNVSIVNEDSKNYYITNNNGKRAGGLIGLIQTTSTPVNDCLVEISDSFVNAEISGSEQIGGIVGAMDNAKPTINYNLAITRCVFAGVAKSSYSTPRVGGIIGYQSGNIGIFNITRCISFGKLYILDGTPVEVSLKTASLIVGGFSSVAENVVRNCVATMEEYNTDYGVDLYSATDLQMYTEIFAQTFGSGYEANWSFVYAVNPENPRFILEAPYVTLNFLD